MPIVFVHGVANRDPEFTKGIAERNGFFKRLTIPEYLKATPIEPMNPYWGKYGAMPLWNNGSLPKPEDRMEALGADSEFNCKLLEVLPERTTAKNVIVTVARSKSLQEAIDILLAQDLLSDLEPTSRAALEQQLLTYVEANQKPDWIFDKNIESNDQFVSELIRKSTPPPQGGVEKLGPAEWWDKLKEAAERVGDAVPRLVTKPVVDVVRTGMQEKLTQFLGDAFVYFQDRWVEPKAGQNSAYKKDGKIPGPIANEVIQALLKARVEADKPGQADNKLIVVAHSMGGNIVYDLCTDFFKDNFTIDVFVTVGSQFSMFQEIEMFPGATVKKNPLTKVAVPQNIKKWINVYDPNDVLSFCGTRVFDRVEDHPYNTGYDTVRAHTGYFNRASFYQRLGVRISEALKHEPAVAVAAGGN